MTHQRKIMGIVNVTPDSFSDGGLYAASDDAVAHGLRLIKEGADILDVGGESTRPGAAPVSPEEEQRRVIPVVRALAQDGAFVSIDTRHADTMDKALEAGARMVNDVSALTHDPASLSVVQEHDCMVCLMHMQGDPETMQSEPDYDDVVQDVFNYLSKRIEVCLKEGIKQERIICDVGIGFGKSLAHNLALLRDMDRFHALGVPLLLGTSRKSFIEKVMNHAVPPSERLGGSLATVLDAYQKGVQYFRVHDVAQTVQALSVQDAIKSQ